MKKRIATLLMLAFSTALLLGGCGESSEKEAVNKESDNSSAGVLSKITGTKSEILSECLSEEKVIGYTVETVDKSETPKNIFFFENGKVTIIPGKEFGLTMGDFSKMSDKEIWSKYETVWEEYSTRYKNEELEANRNMLESKLSYYNTTKNDIKCIIDEGVMRDYCIDLFASFLGDIGEYEFADKISAKGSEWWSEWNGEETPLTDVFTEEELATINTYVETAIESLQEQLNAECKGPFKEMPFSFVVETDRSGNEVMSESLLYPTLDYSLTGTKPSIYYDSLNFALGLTREEVIYDTTYNCIALSKSGSFLTREVMDIDSLDSKNILIDLSSDEKNELFREEVMSRYE